MFKVVVTFFLLSFETLLASDFLCQMDTGWTGGEIGTEYYHKKVKSFNLKPHNNLNFRFQGWIFKQVNIDKENFSLFIKKGSTVFVQKNSFNSDLSFSLTADKSKVIFTCISKPNLTQSKDL